MRDQMIRIRDDALYQIIDGTVMVLGVERGLYFRLTDVGARFWELLEVDPSLGHAMDVLAGEYDVLLPVLLQDITDLVAQMKAAGLVDVHDSSDARGIVIAS